MNLEVRPMTAAEAEQAAAIEATASEGWGAGDLAEEAASDTGRVFLLLAGGAAVGAAVFQLVLDEGSLLSITLLPGQRGQGLGHYFLSRCLAALQAEGMRSCFLEVRSQNAAAIALYRSFGFVQAGLRRGFYQAPADDALVMKMETN